ncbi:nucleotidyltransferase domain-containing protein [Saccharopolyspora hattusasensis]|uniref:nucleotidyltransferase domain-containing protein n=1 Tax=Saccharopolyspora hattusasensis TaxID=1128679 RepID=UPI003D955382
MTPTCMPWGAWDSATPAEVASLFGSLHVPWWLAGGYAIELALERRLREHADIDVLLLRRDQLAVQDALAGWEWWAADPPGRLRPWRPGERLPDGVHDIWCRPGADEPWRIQVMLDESVGDDWVSQRNPHLRRPVTTLGHTSSDGIPYLAPEIQLFYKAKEPRPKDDADFAAAQPMLSTGQRRWLADAISDTYGHHPWLQQLLPQPPSD